MTHCIIQTEPEGITKLWTEYKATKRGQGGFAEFELGCQNWNTMFGFHKLESD